MVQGTVVFFHDEGGYGFIETDDEDDDEDVYFHMQNTPYEEDLGEDERVEFETEQGEDDEGPRAVNLTRLEEEE